MTVYHDMLSIGSFNFSFKALSMTIASWAGINCHHVSHSTVILVIPQIATPL